LCQVRHVISTPQHPQLNVEVLRIQAHGEIQRLALSSTEFQILEEHHHPCRRIISWNRHPNALTSVH
jgi:hypothetical protein